MKEKYTHARTCVYNINYHIVWCVKYRRKVLTPEISTRLYTLVSEIGVEKGFNVVECKVGESDHVHCFVSAPPKISITQIVKYLKGISGNTLLKEFPELRNHLWKGQFGTNHISAKQLVLHQKKTFFDTWKGRRIVSYEQCDQIPTLSNI